VKEYEDRWERAERSELSSVVKNLEGDWRVERLSGLLPMPFVWKKIRGRQGTTRVSSFGPRFTFRLEQREGHVAMIYLVMLAMAGSLMISYTRARAEALGLDCKVGLMPRAERVVLIGGAALFFGLAWQGLVLKIVIIILAVMTNLTAFQRIVWVYQHARGVPLDE
jgi:hypothetical protein